MRQLLLFFLLLMTNTLFAAETAAEKLNTLLSDVKSMRADFEQTVHDGDGRQVQVAKGSMALKRPGYFRWQTDKPIPQTIIANKNKLWVYDPDLEQVTIRQLKAAAGSTPALFLSHTTDDVTKNYKVASKKMNGGDIQWFGLIPTSADNMFEEIDFGFKGKVLERMRLKDHLGHMTSISFKNISTNKSIPKGLFIFKPTNEVDVIDETKQAN